MQQLSKNNFVNHVPRIATDICFRIMRHRVNATVGNMNSLDGEVAVKCNAEQQSWDWTHIERVLRQALAAAGTLARVSTVTMVLDGNVTQWASRCADIATALYQALQHCIARAATFRSPLTQRRCSLPAAAALAALL